MTGLTRLDPHPNETWPHSGSVVRVSPYGYEGIVTGAAFPDEAWMDGQSVPVTEEERNGHWCSVLVFSGGAVNAAHGRVEILVPAHKALRTLHDLIDR